MVIINTDPWEDRSSSQPEQTHDTESEKKEKTLFGFQDLASDYYQVRFIWSQYHHQNFKFVFSQLSWRQFQHSSKIEGSSRDSWIVMLVITTTYPRYYDNVVDLEYVGSSGQ